MFSSRRLRRLGWLFFALMWIPFTGIFIGMAKMPGGSYDWIELPLLTRGSMLGTGALMVLALLFLSGSAVIGAAQNRSLLAHGQLASATIKGIEPTGQTVNNYYVGMSFLLDVRPATEPSFQARAEKMLPMHMIPRYTLGSSVQVRFDPHSKAVAIVEENPS
ncbi:MAG: hypothetical protein JW730_19130 [Anaerolineales bacterium]|nr:hypothetical protein [Anaerolineales bacterium]